MSNPPKVISCPSGSVLQAETDRRSAAKEGMSHFISTSFPTITNSSPTRVSYDWLTAVVEFRRKRGEKKTKKRKMREKGGKKG